MRNILFISCIILIQLVNAQQLKLNCSELIEQKKINFQNYLKKIHQLPSGFVYNGWLPLRNFTCIRSQEYVEFNMASYQDIAQTELSPLNIRYVMGYFYNDDRSISILTVSQSDSIDSINGKLSNGFELLLYDEFGNKIAQYNPVRGSFCLVNNKLVVDNTVKETRLLVDEVGNLIEVNEYFKLKYTISASSKGVYIEENGNLKIIIEKTDQSNYNYLGKLYFSNGSIYEGAFRIGEKQVQDRIIIDPLIEGHNGILKRNSGSILKGVFCDTVLCNFPDYAIGNKIIKENDTLSKILLLKSEGIQLINNPKNYTIESFSIQVFGDNQISSSFEGSGLKNILQFNDDMRKTLLSCKNGKIFISMRGRAADKNTQLPPIAINFR